MRYLFFPILLAFFFPNLFLKQIAYISETNGKKIYTTWRIQHDKTNIILLGEDREEIIKMDYNTNWILQTYHLKSLQEDTEYVLNLEGKTLNISGKVRGEKVERSLSLPDSDPWIEHLGFGLQPFLKSSKKFWNFYSINPNDFSLVPMKAIKQKNEIIKIKDHEYKAIRLKVTLQGFKSLFWSASLWFDQDNFRLLKYEGNTGPNTPTTVTTIEG